MAMFIKCPQCNADFDVSIPSKHKPFCSERCKLIDLGAWADGTYSIPAEDSPMSEQVTGAQEYLEE